MVFNRDVHTKVRKAREVPENLRKRVVDICREFECVTVCYLLDVIEPATGDIKLFVNLTLVDPEQDFQRVGAEIQKVFVDFPEYRQRFFIGADVFSQLDPSLAAYTKDYPAH